MYIVNNIYDAANFIASTATSRLIHLCACRLFVKNMLQQQERHVCTMTTVSDIIHRHGLSHVSLLKIDVERAELDVLTGIAESDWQRISQVVLEVHDVQDRLHQVKQLLTEKAGFTSMIVTQDEQLKGSTIFNMYCCRTQSKPSKSYTNGHTTHAYHTASK